MTANESHALPTAEVADLPRAPEEVLAFQQAWLDLHAQAVQTLTLACRLRFPQVHSDGTAAATAPIDLADFLASVLAAVAANVGSIDRLTAGRPGSWESDLVAQLVTRTVGRDETWLYEHRTEPVTVQLNVLDLAWDLPGFPDIEAATEHALEPFYAATEPDPARTLTDDEWDALEVARAATEDAVTDAYARVYADYAAAFTAAVHRAADQVLALSVPVTVTVVHDPRTPHVDAVRISNPPDTLDGQTSDDHLATRLWNTAAATVPIPTAPTITLPKPPPAVAEDEP
ncbi:hypothetical protein [Kineosporia sp. A_224]|uniref:hypothetical protein n=1 Tax=Kineosporia sp. A_224 TaxID=1962180 RepID=UPI00117BC2BA|nr:hypothetical protein [Kineosporia sp. A_224]